jgi:DNA repair protein RecO (recombination protein O)
LIPLEVMKLEGVIIDEKPYGETSKILNIITKEKGIIGVLAKGAKRLKSPLRSVSQRFCYANFEVSYKENKLSTLISADVINPLINIKKDIEKISYINFISELTNQVLNQAKSNLIYNDYIACILKINEGFDAMVITNILELKYLDYLGVSPTLDGCVTCGGKNVVTLSSSKGGFVCHNHYSGEYKTSEKTIKIIRMLKYVDISKISKLELSDVVKNEINSFINEYYDMYTGLYLKSKSFLKNIVKIK